MPEFVVVMITASSSREAIMIGETLVNEKLAACTNLISQVQSIFFWKNKLCKENEALLLIKTCTHLLKDIKKRITELHSYEVPEIIVLPVVDGSEEYLSWIKDTVQ